MTINPCHMSLFRCLSARDTPTCRWFSAHTIASCEAQRPGPVCMHVCMCMYMCIRMAHVVMCAFMYQCVNLLAVLVHSSSFFIMRVCMYACMHVRMRVCMYVIYVLYACMRVRKLVSKYVCMNSCLGIHVAYICCACTHAGIQQSNMYTRTIELCHY
jgi:hypothetical protein